METIDLITLRARRELGAFTRETAQPTKLDLLDLEPLRQINNIEIDEEHITITYNEKISRSYNTNAVTYKEWSYKYNEDTEFVNAIAKVIDLARKHLRDLPETLACPPGCANCCMGYEPFVSSADVQRIADHLGMSYKDVMKNYVNERRSADGFVVGWLQKVDNDDITSKCVFLKGSGSGHYYCGIYPARPHDCAEFSPIGCEDVDTDLRHDAVHKVGRPFQPRHEMKHVRGSTLRGRQRRRS
ncbi:MAG: YkgJ family cysteine cluster protein [Candidatus Eremiobacteraeota bacterium]|nr:YkgJ family cysteine cluster protein [Candidatus Eremiobacteraeota bacterium]